MDSWQHKLITPQERKSWRPVSDESLSSVQEVSIKARSHGAGCFSDGYIAGMLNPFPHEIQEQGAATPHHLEPQPSPRGAKHRSGIAWGGMNLQTSLISRKQCDLHNVTETFTVEPSWGDPTYAGFHRHGSGDEKYITPW